MTIWQSLFLGALQGLTEFLPVSSSGHLVLAQTYLRIKEPPLILDPILHLGTLAALLLFFRSDMLQIMRSFQSRTSTSEGGDEYRRLTLYIIIASIPAAFVGLGFNSLIEKTFNSIIFVGFMFLITAAALWAAEIWQVEFSQKKMVEMSFMDAIWVGLAQAAAVLPGISRSGTTISAGLNRRLTGESAARFSFLLSIPVVAGSAVLSFYKAAANRIEGMSFIILSGLTAFIVGWAALGLLMYVLRHQRLKIFAVYCLLLGLLTLAAALF